MQIAIALPGRTELVALSESVTLGAVPLTERSLTAAEFQGLVNVPPELVGKEQREERIPEQLKRLL